MLGGAWATAGAAERRARDGGGPAGTLKGRRLAEAVQRGHGHQAPGQVRGRGAVAVSGCGGAAVSVSGRGGGVRARRGRSGGSRPLMRCRCPQAAGAGAEQRTGAERGAGGRGAALRLPHRPGLRGHVLGGPRAARARDQ